jgi:hypothetical protein
LVELMKSMELIKLIELIKVVKLIELIKVDRGLMVRFVTVLQKFPVNVLFA